jgi:hypothetical protein
MHRGQLADAGVTMNTATQTGEQMTTMRSTARRFGTCGRVRAACNCGSVEDLTGDLVYVSGHKISRAHKNSEG